MLKFHFSTPELERWNETDCVTKKHDGNVRTKNFALMDFFFQAVADVF